MVQIDHVHFYVEDAKTFRDWLVSCLGFQPIGSTTDLHTHTEIVQSGSICFVLSSPLTSSSPVAEFLAQHPPGVADIAFRVDRIEGAIERAIASGVQLWQPLRQQTDPQGDLKWCQIAAWGALSHTLIQREGVTSLLPGEGVEWGIEPEDGVSTQVSPFLAIDHVVLNVAAGQLESAARWYERVLGFEPKQQFSIATDRSSLHSQVMVHPQTGVQIPINEPTSSNSQIQEFLDANRGAGIQHIALRTHNIVKTIAQLREAGLPFLEVPSTYYTQLRQRPGFSLSHSEWHDIKEQQILVDWQEENFPIVLLQTFTKPIFSQPTFFFEVIDRRVACVNGKLIQAQGFGEGNFRALFEAVEREQIKRESCL